MFETPNPTPVVVSGKKTDSVLRNTFINDTKGESFIDTKFKTSYAMVNSTPVKTHDYLRRYYQQVSVSVYKTISY